MNKDSEKLDNFIKIIKYLDKQNALGFYPKTEDIRKHINSFRPEQDWKSERSINRYLWGIQEVFDIVIEKRNGSRSGYFINKTGGADFKEVYKAVQLFEKAALFQNMLKHSSKALNYFSFDTLNFQGLDKIDPIVKAIINKKIIKIRHKRFDNDISSSREIEPCLIKEYLNRWYLIAYDLSKNDFRTFGLDRLEQVEILEKRIKKHRTEEIKERFDHTIGLVYSDPEKVVLAFEKRQGKYFIANPWHQKYKIIEDNDKGLIIEMKISINYELEQKLLMHHNLIKVIEPQSLIDKIKLLHSGAVNQYQ